MFNQLSQNLLNQGTLRLLLQAVALLFILALPFAEPAWQPTGADIVMGAVVPAMAPIIFILLMLDVLMCVIWKSDSTDEEEIARFRFAIKAHLSVGAVLIVLWLLSFQDALFG